MHVLGLTKSQQTHIYLKRFLSFNTNLNRLIRGICSVGYQYQIVLVNLMWVNKVGSVYNGDRVNNMYKLWARS